MRITFMGSMLLVLWGVAAHAETVIVNGEDVCFSLHRATVLREMGLKYITSMYPEVRDYASNLYQVGTIELERLNAILQAERKRCS